MPPLSRLLLALLALSTSLLADPARPNIVVILADDYGYGSAGCYGAPSNLVRTPNLDRLAQEGRRFTDANTTSSVCSPTRYSLITGRYCWRTSLKFEVLSTFAPLHIEPGRLNMASLLKKHGYATAAVGKWHLGYGTADDSPKWRPDFTAELSPGPLDIGFDYHFGVPANHGDITGIYVENRFVYGLRSGKIPPGMKIAGPVPDDDNYKPTYEGEDTEGGRGAGRILEIDAPRRKNERVMATLADKAVNWMAQQPKDKPIFLYFTPVAVHNPVTPDKDLAGQSAAGLYGDWIHELDRGVGRILQALEAQGRAQDTLLIFTSDNGGVRETARKDIPQTIAFDAGLAVNGALRGGKHHVWEGGFKVPFIVRWPGKAAPGTVSHEMISLADILATTAAIVGEPLPPPAQAAEDSRSFLPAILGDPAKPIRDDMIVHSSDGVFAIRKGPYKWIEGIPAEGIKAAVRKSRAEEFRPQLYDTNADPAETKDVSAAHPEVVQELSALLTRYRDGGYSRELPPIVDPPKTKVATLSALPGAPVLSESFAQMPAAPWKVAAGKWSVKDGGLWGAQQPTDQNGANVHGPCGITDGTIEYEISFDNANRHSLRIECGAQQSFRLEISRSHVGLTKNPSKGEPREAIEPLARKALKLENNVWYPVRITFHGNEATAQVNDVVIKGSHAVVGSPKTGLNFLVFDQSAGFRNLRITR